MVDPAIIPIIQKLDANPEDVDATTALCKWFLDHDQIQQLTVLLEKIAPRRKTPALAADLWAQSADLWAKRLNRPDKALPLFQKSLELHGKCLRALRGLRDVYLFMRKWGAAADLMQRELETIPDTSARDRIELLKELADTRAQAGDNAGQLVALEQLVALAPREYDLMRKLVALLVARSRAEDTPEEQKTKDRIQGAKLLGMIARNMGGPDRIKFAEAALQLYPGDDGAFSALSEYMIEEGREEELITRQIKFLTSNPTSAAVPQVRRSMARTHMKYGRIDQAIEALEPVGTTDPDAGQQLAQLYQRTGRLDDLARLMPNLPLSSDPKQRLAELRKRADLALQAGNHDARFTIVRDILAVEATDPEALAAAERHCRAHNTFEALCDLYWNAVRSSKADSEFKQSKLKEIAGLLEQRCNDVPGAIAAWDALLAMDPDHDTAGIELERLLTIAQRHDDLIALMEKRATAARTPVDRRARLLRLAYAYRAKNAIAEEVASLDKLRTFEPDDDEVFSAWIDARRRAGNPDGLLDAARERVQRAPESPSRWRVLAGFLEATGALEEAASSWMKVRTLDPSDPLAWQNEMRTLQLLDRASDIVSALVARADNPIAAGTQAGALYAQAATIAHEARDHVAAVTQAERALRFMPDDPSLVQILHLGYRATGATDKLAGLLKSRTTELPDSPEKLDALRTVARSTGPAGTVLSEEAVGAWQQVRTLAKKLGAIDDTEALDALARNAESVGNWVEQAEMLRLAVEAALNRETCRALMMQRAGVLANKMGRAEEALAVITDLVERVDPTYAPAWALAAEWASRAGNKPLLARALEFRLERSTQVDEQRRFATQLLGLYEDALQDVDGALRALERLHALAPDDDATLARLCSLYERRERFAEAMDGLEKLASHVKDNTQRVVVARRLVEVAESHLRDPARAVRALSAWAREGHTEIVQTLKALCERAGLMNEFHAVIPQVATPAPITDRPAPMHGHGSGSEPLVPDEELTDERTPSGIIGASPVTVRPPAQQPHEDETPSPEVTPAGGVPVMEEAEVTPMPVTPVPPSRRSIPSALPTPATGIASRAPVPLAGPPVASPVTPSMQTSTASGVFQPPGESHTPGSFADPPSAVMTPSGAFRVPGSGPRPATAMGSLNLPPGPPGTGSFKMPVVPLAPPPAGTSFETDTPTPVPAMPSRPSMVEARPVAQAAVEAVSEPEQVDDFVSLDDDQPVPEVPAAPIGYQRVMLIQLDNVLRRNPARHTFR